MSLRSAFFFCSKTCDTISGQSVVVWPGKRLWRISGHLGLAVMVRKRSGLWKCLQMVIASWNSWAINLGLPTCEEGRISLCPKGPTDGMGNLVTLRYLGGPDSSMVEHLVQFQKGLGSSPGPVTFYAAISRRLRDTEVLYSITLH